MTFLVSYNWLKEYLDTKLSPENFARRLSLSGPSVERIIHQGEEWNKIVVGKILDIGPHPNADKLQLVKVRVNKGRPLKIVCGGFNLRKGMKVAVALPGAKVRWHGEGEYVKLQPAKIRGIQSEGMICAASEIELKEAFPHGPREILDISRCPAEDGTPLAEALNLRDSIFEIEITTNRPDAMCVVGIAREASAILGSKFMPPPAPSLSKRKTKDDGLKLDIQNQEPELCLRYQAVVIDGARIEESPWWLKQRLLGAGMRPVNNIVDITNYVLLELGQPLHAFDYDKIKADKRGLTLKKIIVRRAKHGEKILALDGNQYSFVGGEIVIADTDMPIALGGIIGGKETGISEKTRRIVFESASFDSASVRKTARALGLQTNSSNIFEKNPSVRNTEPAILRAVELAQKITGGKAVSPLRDLHSAEFRRKKINLPLKKTNEVIGAPIPLKKMIEILERLGFRPLDSKHLTGTKASIQKKAKQSSRESETVIQMEVPYWRENDISIPEDLIEEIARIYGYHNLPSVLPTGEISAETQDKIFYWREFVKNALKGAGYSEIYSYSFVGENLLEKTGYKTENCQRITNPLSADLEFMRPSLLPGILAVVRDNQELLAAGKQASEKIYELSKVYIPSPKTELPQEESRLTAVVFSKSENSELFFQVKGITEHLLKETGVKDYYFSSQFKYPLWHPVRTVGLVVGKRALGIVGEIHPKVLETLGIECRVAAVDLDFKKLTDCATVHKTYSALPQYPEIRRDISFIVDKKIKYEKIQKTIFSVHELINSVELFDIYEGKEIPKEKKSLALHLIFRSPHRTLEAEEVQRTWEKLVQKLEDNLGAEVRM